MHLKVGDRLGSTTCDAEVIVVRAPSRDLDLTCGGALVGAVPAETTVPVEEDGDGALVGKRYTDEGSGLELLCTKGGRGSLRVDGELLIIKAAKSLPSSD